LKSPSGAARAQIVAPELLDQLDIAMNEAPARFTRVSEGNDFRRLRVTSKATEVFEIAMLAHDTPPLKKAARVPRAAFITGARLHAWRSTP